MNERKFDYANAERITGLEFKYSMGAVALYVLIHFGFLDIGSGMLWIIATTGLAVYIWWSFRAYFIKVNDHSTAKWMTIIIAIYALFGASSLLVRIMSNIFNAVPTGLLALAKLLFIGVGIGLIAFVAVCIKMIATNRHHSFGLKRIAISAIFAIPIYILVMLVANIQFVGQLWNITNQANEALSQALDPSLIYETSPIFQSVDPFDMLSGVSGIFSGIFSFFKFFWNCFVMLPYFFLFHHFYRADKLNGQKEFGYYGASFLASFSCSNDLGFL